MFSFRVSRSAACDGVLQFRQHAVRGDSSLRFVHLEHAAQALFDAFGTFCLFAAAPDQDTRDNTAGEGEQDEHAGRPCGALEAVRAPHTGCKRTLRSQVSSGMRQSIFVYLTWKT